MDKLNLNKTVFERKQYTNVIDNSFTQLVPPPTTIAEETTESKVDAFFNQYQELFYDIPKTGETNSHEYLVKQSSEYIDYQFIDEDVQALLDEISSLRQENLDLNQQIIDLTTKR
jgi:hypothetical protein